MLARRESEVNALDLHYVVDAMLISESVQN